MKILLIGDLRNGYNYGAIATSEALVNLLHSHYPDAYLKTIDMRSIIAPTPPEGWDTMIVQDRVETKKRDIRFVLGKILRLLKKICVFLAPYGIMKKVEKRKADISRLNYCPTYSYHAPCLLRDYEQWWERVQGGEVMQYEKKLFEWADVVVVNGEGNIVKGTDENGVYRSRALYVLYMTWLAKVKFLLPTYMVNHSVDPDNADAVEILQNLYPRLDKVIVREPLSIDKLKNFGVKNAEYAPDALFSYSPNVQWEPSDSIKEQIDFTKPFILLGDSSGFKNSYSRIQWAVPYVMSCLIKKLQEIVPQVVFVDGFNGGNQDIVDLISKTGIGYVNLNSCSYHDLYHIMERAEIFISGRWHASILAVLAQCPILLWGADSHKTRALYKVIDYKYRFFETATLPIHIDDVVDEVKLILSEKELVREQFCNMRDRLSIQAHNNVTCISTK